MYTPIQSVKVFEQVAKQIEKRILVGELRSGDRLPTERERRKRQLSQAVQFVWPV